MHAEGRAALIREEERFDLLQMSGIDTWTALASGAYMLAENFLYTSDAVRDMFAVLNQGGSVQLTRLSGDVEVLRLLGTVHDAWQEVGSGAFEDCVAVVHAADFARLFGGVRLAGKEQAHHGKQGGQQKDASNLVGKHRH